MWYNKHTQDTCAVVYCSA